MHWFQIEQAIKETDIPVYKFLHSRERGAFHFCFSFPHTQRSLEASRPAQWLELTAAGWKDLYGPIIP